jgi:hypothetical protein
MAERVNGRGTDAENEKEIDSGKRREKRERYERTDGQTERSVNKMK